MSRTGRLCTTSASSEPIVTTRRTPSSFATSRMSPQNVRHRTDGSAPAASTRSWSPSGTSAVRISMSGQTISDASGDERSTSGRVAWKS